MAYRFQFILRSICAMLFVVSVLRPRADGQEAGQRCISPNACACAAGSDVPCCHGLDLLQAGNNQVLVYQPGSCMCCKRCLAQNSTSQSTPNQSSYAIKYACSNQEPLQ